MRVTLDTNVWTRLVFPERYRESSNHSALVAIRDAIQRGRVRAFISEGFGTLEAIRKKDRARFYVQSMPVVEVTKSSQGVGFSGMVIQIKANHALHPGIGEEFDKQLDEALAIGLRLLPTPYIGLAIPSRFLNSPDIYAEGVFEVADYNERFGDVVRVIADRGVGYGVIPALAKEFTERLDGPRPKELSDRALIYKVYEYACASGLKRDKSQIEKAFAELADGDVAAAHIAYGNDYLCTEDRGGSALGPSIFDETNRAWLKSKYDVNFLDVQQLTRIL